MEEDGRRRETWEGGDAASAWERKHRYLNPVQAADADSTCRAQLKSGGEQLDADSTRGKGGHRYLNLAQAADADSTCWAKVARKGGEQLDADSTRWAKVARSGEEQPEVAERPADDEARVPRRDEKNGMLDYLEDVKARSLDGLVEENSSANPKGPTWRVGAFLTEEGEGRRDRKGIGFGNAECRDRVLSFGPGDASRKGRTRALGFDPTTESQCQVEARWDGQEVPGVTGGWPVRACRVRDEPAPQEGPRGVAACGHGLWKLPQVWEPLGRGTDEGAAAGAKVLAAGGGGPGGAGREAGPLAGKGLQAEAERPARERPSPHPQRSPRRPLTRMGQPRGVAESHATRFGGPWYCGGRTALVRKPQNPLKDRKTGPNLLAAPAASLSGLWEGKMQVAPEPMTAWGRRAQATSKQTDTLDGSPAGTQPVESGTGYSGVGRSLRAPKRPDKACPGVGAAPDEGAEPEPCWADALGRGGPEPHGYAGGWRGG